jgi:hypothetical protein
MSLDNSAGRYGLEDVEAKTSQYNAIRFIVDRILDARCHAALVRVVAVGSGTVDVQPMVNQLDGQNVPVPHGVVHGLPYFISQAGANAVILTPEKGDVGLAVFADRDISSVKATRDVANPGSMRRADMADGLYIGGFLNGVASQFVRFTPDGIAITSPQKITLTAPTVELNASDAVTVTTPQFTVNGASTFNGPVNAPSDTITGNEVVGGGKTLSTHKHDKVKFGTDISGEPV